jgi:AraC-like DNA-binding protein
MTTILCQKYTTNRDNPFIVLHGKGNNFGYHWHDEIELLYLFKGNITFVIGSKAYDMQEKDIAIVKSGEVHRYESESICEHCVIEFGHYLDTDIFKMPIFRYTGMPSILKWNDKQEGYSFAIKSNLYKIITLLARSFVSKVKLMENKKHITMSYMGILQEVFDYIESHYKEPISIEDVSKVANFSPHYFNKFFKNATGKTFARYLNNVRIDKAQALLRSSNQTITNIAYEVGFNSIKTFNRLFKEIVKCTPSEYRNK